MMLKENGQEAEGETNKDLFNLYKLFEQGLNFQGFDSEDMGHSSQIVDELDSCKLRFNQCGYLNMKMIVQSGFMKIAGDKDKSIIPAKSNVFETTYSVVFLSGQLTEDKIEID